MIYMRELPVVLKILVVLNRLVNAEEEKSVTTVFWQRKGKKNHNVKLTFMLQIATH